MEIKKPNTTTIQIQDSTLQSLFRLKNGSRETYDSVILRLVDAYEYCKIKGILKPNGEIDDDVARLV